MQLSKIISEQIFKILLEEETKELMDKFKRQNNEVKVVKEAVFMPREIRKLENETEESEEDDQIIAGVDTSVEAVE